MCYFNGMKTNTAADKEELNLVMLAQQYSDDDNARELFESMLWPDGPVVHIARIHHLKKTRNHERTRWQSWPSRASQKGKALEIRHYTNLSGRV
jgi:hypothetical protein